jgi:3',5'-cyclic-AMP phosphodiesterase
MRIAQVTDLHLVEPAYARRDAAARYRLRYLNAGRAIDPEARRARVASALRAARGAEHVVITGDLTEDGSPVQFELLADLLDGSGLAPDRVTLVPGNHDFYGAHDAFARALRGPLRAYARASTPGRPVELSSALLLPVSTAVPQTCLRSGGLLQSADVERIEALARGRRRTLVVAQHHPPTRQRGALRQLVDGLANARSATELLSRHEHVHVLHGHLHTRRSRGLVPGRPEQVHCAPAALESEAHLRFYELDEHGLVPLEAVAPEGRPAGAALTPLPAPTSCR